MAGMYRSASASSVAPHWLRPGGVVRVLYMLKTYSTIWMKGSLVIKVEGNQLKAQVYSKALIGLVG